MRHQLAKILNVIAILLLIVLVVLVIIFAKPNKITLHFVMPDNEEILSAKAGKQFNFPNPSEYDGYTFLGWKDSSGNMVSTPGLAWSDEYYVAQYGMALNADVHQTFMDADNAYFRPDDALTVGEAVNIFYTLLNTDLEGTASFLDIDSNDDLYKPAALLKELGVIQGNYLHPDDFLSELEFSDYLKHFYSEADMTDFSFSDELITREKTAVIMCRLLGRYGDANHDYDKVGELADVETSSENYWYIAETCVPHEKQGNGPDEIWTSSVPCVCTENGFYFVGTALHYIGDDGHPVSNTEIGSVKFDEDGSWTSGDKALDLQIKKILNDKINPATQTRTEMLRILYNHVRDDYDYCYGQDYLPGQTGWANTEASKMLERKIGNCYRFAGLFAVLARSIGFDAEECCGVMDKDSNLHSWVEINIDGVQYLFDPQYEARFPSGQEEYDRFMKTGDIFNRYNAMRECRENYNSQ